MCALTFSHRCAGVNKSFSQNGGVMMLWISEAHIIFWIFFIVAHCNIIRTIREIRRSENCVTKKMGCKNFLASHPPPVSFFITFFS